MKQNPKGMEKGDSCKTTEGDSKKVVNRCYSPEIPKEIEDD
jgi:hypothetical protein